MESLFWMFVVFLSVFASVSAGARPRPTWRLAQGCVNVWVSSVSAGARPRPTCGLAQVVCECVGVVGTGGARLRPTCGGNECV
ncbi:hypothetical protein [uncultured Duncaniella sp.]|nr:hypothetical protein [uncultured Duncaniella sp.]